MKLVFNNWMEEMVRLIAHLVNAIQFLRKRFSKGHIPERKILDLKGVRFDAENLAGAI